MNIVDLISSQLSGDVLGKLGGLIGANESQTRTATNAAVPALLNVFAKLASSNSGADQLAKAMGGLDLGMLGNLAGALGGSQASGIGSLGGNLLGPLAVAAMATVSRRRRACPAGSCRCSCSAPSASATTSGTRTRSGARTASWPSSKTSRRRAPHGRSH
jgi:hypothetical protein